MKNLKIIRESSIFPLLDNYTYSFGHKKIRANNFFHIIPLIINFEDKIDGLEFVKKTFKKKLYILVALIPIIIAIIFHNNVSLYIVLLYILFIWFLYENFINVGKIGVIKDNGKEVGFADKGKSNYRIVVNYLTDIYEIYLHSNNIISFCKNNEQCGIVKLYEYIDMGVFNYSVKYDELIIEEKLFYLLVVLADIEFFGAFSKHKGTLFMGRPIFAPLKIHTRNRYDVHKDRINY